MSNPPSPFPCPSCKKALQILVPAKSPVSGPCPHCGEVITIQMEPRRIELPPEPHLITRDPRDSWVHFELDSIPGIEDFDHSSSLRRTRSQAQTQSIEESPRLQPLPRQR